MNPENTNNNPTTGGPAPQDLPTPATADEPMNKLVDQALDSATPTTEPTSSATPATATGTPEESLANAAAAFASAPASEPISVSEPATTFEPTAPAATFAESTTPVEPANTEAPVSTSEFNAAPLDEPVIEPLSTSEPAVMSEEAIAPVKEPAISSEEPAISTPVEEPITSFGATSFGSAAPEPATPTFGEPASEPTVASEVPAETTSSADSSTTFEPAAPVPGSIGSSTSFSDPTVPPIVAAPGKKKSPLTLILVIVLIVASLGVAAVLALPQLLNANKPKATPSVQPAPQVSIVVMNCELEGTPEVRAQIGNATELKDVFSAEYQNDELSFLSFTRTATYADATAAAAGLELLKTQDDASMKLLGFKKNPFTAKFEAKKAVVTFTQEANADEITTENSTLFGIMPDLENKKVDTTQKTLKKFYEAQKYTCTVE